TPVSIAAADRIHGRLFVHAAAAQSRPMPAKSPPKSDRSIAVPASPRLVTPTSRAAASGASQMPIAIPPKPTLAIDTAVRARPVRVMTELPFVNRGEPHARGVALPSGKVRAASDLAKNAENFRQRATTREGAHRLTRSGRAHV